jgi:hypothetical protein
VDYNKLIEEKDLYAHFVSSKVWAEALDSIASISKEVADSIGTFGIGEKIDDDGDYDFESGQLLECLSKSFLNDFEEEIENCYDIVCDLASSYANFVTGCV